MAYMPVICDTCGTLFVTQSFIGGSGTATIDMVGNRLGPCPTCGAMGRIPDGTYNFANDALTLLQGPQRTKDELRRFANILRGIIDGDTNVEEAQVTVRHEVPGLASLAEEIAKTRNAQFRMFLIKAILTIIGILLASQSVNIQDVDIDIHDVINITIEQEAQPPNESKSQIQQIPRSNSGLLKTRKVGRNEPCACGSVKKYKKCCGDPTR